MRYCGERSIPPFVDDNCLRVQCREVSSKEFNSNDSRGPKSVSAFIIKLSEVAPRLVIKQLTLLAKQLDSEVSHY